MNTQQALTKYPKAFLYNLLTHQYGIDFKQALHIDGVTLHGLDVATNSGPAILPPWILFYNGYNPTNIQYNITSIALLIKMAFEDKDYSDLRSSTVRYLVELPDNVIRSLFSVRLRNDLLVAKRRIETEAYSEAVIQIPNQLLTFIELLYLRLNITNVSRTIRILARRLEVFNAIHTDTLNVMSTESIAAFFIAGQELIPESVVHTANSETVDRPLTAPELLDAILNPRNDPEDWIRITPDTPPTSTQPQRHKLMGEGYTESKLNQKLQGCYVLYKGEPVFIHEIRSSLILYSKINGTRLLDPESAYFSVEFNIDQPILGFINTDIGVYFIERKHVDNNSSRYKIAFCPSKIKKYRIHTTPDLNGFRKSFKDKVILHEDMLEPYMVSKLLVKQYFTVSEAVTSLITGKRIACAITEDIALIAAYNTNSIYVWLGTKVVGYYSNDDCKLHIHTKEVSQFFEGIEVIYE